MVLGLILTDANDSVQKVFSDTFQKLETTYDDYVVVKNVVKDDRGYLSYMYAPITDQHKPLLA